MTAEHKKILIVCLALVAATLLAGFGVATYFVKSAKPRLEKIASAATGMQVTCRSLHVSLLPLSISAREVTISNQGAAIILIPSLRASIDLKALVKGQVSIQAFNMNKPEFIVTLLENGTWNFETPKWSAKKTTGESPFLLPIVNIRDGHLVLHAGENPLEVQGIRLAVRDLSLAGDNDQPLLSRLSLTGDLSGRELRYDKIIIQDFTFHLQGTAGSFVFDPVTFQAFGGSAKCIVKAEMSGKSPLVTVHLELSHFRAEDFFASITKEELLRGEMQLVLDFTARGVAQQELLRSLNGKASMTGQNLTSTRFDLDNLLEEFIQSQQFDLVDLGAFMIIGPLGPTLTKGFDFGMVENATHGGSTEVRQLLSLWQIDEGKAVTRDVALATGKNRIAMSGEVDIAAERFRNLVVAVVDAGGCALVRQEMDGPFENPQVKQPSFIESAAGPLINIFKGAARLITGVECEVFYNGSVAAPEK